MLWGSRFQQPLDVQALRFSSSFHIDKTLIEYDIACSKAHAAMLGTCGIIQQHDAADIDAALSTILSEFQTGQWKPDLNAFEDVHSAVEARLFEKIGECAGKLHTARSRNDQIATDFRLWIKDASRICNEELTELQKTIVYIVKQHRDTIMPGYTHLQRAQPVSLAYHLLAYMEMTERSKKRFTFTCEQADYLPLGSGALAGSTFALDRAQTAQALGFTHQCRHAMDAISDRDFVIDFLNACTICMMHLSRLSEEIILWSSTEWNFIRIGDAFTTGSSLMPQKRNPDIAELIRGKTGRVYSNYICLATIMKGLPLCYNRDMQEDKEPAFDSFTTTRDCVKMMNAMIQTVQVNKDRFTKELDGDFCLATDAAEWLVKKGIPFRQSHEIVGNVIAYAESKRKKLHELTVNELKTIHHMFDQSILELFSIKNVLKRKNTSGSPNPEYVDAQVNFWENRVKQEQ